MIEQKLKPNKEKLRLKNLEISFKNNTTDQAKKKIVSAENLPMVYYYDAELPIMYINKIEINSSKFFPECYVSFNDVYNIMHDIGFPNDNSKLLIIIPTMEKALANVFMEFKIKKFSVNTSTNTKYKKIEFQGVCNVEQLFISEYKSYDDTSYNILKNISSDIGLGFQSNLESSNDKMVRINPGNNKYEFIQDVIDKSQVGDSNFVQSFIDPFYNFNYIDIETELKQDIKQIKQIKTNILENKLISDIKEENNIIEPILTNEPSMKTTNLYFSGENILNQSTDISLKRGYLRNIYFYDIDGNQTEKAGSFKKYTLDTITTEGNNSKTILLKDSPNETFFYNKNINNIQMDRIDTSNVFPDYLQAKCQNEENIQDLQKIIIRIILPICNFNIRRYEKIKLLYTNQNVGIKSNQKNLKLNGEQLVIGVSYNQSVNSLYQTVDLVKRELTIEDI